MNALPPTKNPEASAVQMDLPLILLVDDAPDQLEGLSELLSGCPCRLLKASSGPQALALALREKPDLILLDILMPNRDGIGILRELKKNPATQAIPVVFLTAKSGPEDIVTGLEAGAADYIFKPFHGTELLARLRTHLGFKLAMDRELKLIAELQKVAAEVEHLGGLIPICAHCKKIRNDSGFWQQVEEYVSQRSVAQFSHGLCPDCSPTYFPDYKPKEVRPPVSLEMPESLEPSLPKVLVVDDSPSNIRTLIQFLREDYKILVATSGPVALELALQERPDLILLDVVMPEMSGHEVCLKLKEDPRTSHIPVIFVTGENEECGELKGFGMGAVDYITKPFSLSIVRARVKTHLELKRYRDDLEKQSMTDGLTGIPNRRHLQKFMDLLWSQAIRMRGSITLVLMDVDHFKAYNDHYGHLAGDDCLRRIAKTLEGVIQRKTDLVARFGGEEFLCVLPATDFEGAAMVAESLRSAIEALAIPHEKSSAGAHVTISLGLASCFPTVTDKQDDLLDQADQALYESKKQGRNRWTALPPA
ncbi:MAG: response regulator [Holophaga sp.]|nr:response regulator [Holophaga sp.]